MAWRMGKYSVRSLAGRLIAGLLAGVAPPAAQSSGLALDVWTGPAAFVQSAADLDQQDRFRFALGGSVFRKSWVSAPSSTAASNGLGPLFNARSCQHCHEHNGRGHPPAMNGPDAGAPSLVLRLSVPPETAAHRAELMAHRATVIAEPTYGVQLQPFSIQGHAGEGQLRIAYADAPITLADGSAVHLRRPSYRIEQLRYGPLHPDLMVSPRIAPQVIGLGLLEAVPEDQILEGTIPHGRDGIAGREVAETEPGRDEEHRRDGPARPHRGRGASGFRDAGCDTTDDASVR